MIDRLLQLDEMERSIEEEKTYEKGMSNNVTDATMKFEHRRYYDAN